MKKTIKFATAKNTPTVVNPAQSMQGIRGATKRLLLDSAMALIQEGQIPSLSEVARYAKVSRATVYRYFPSRSQLITAIIDMTLGDFRSFSSNKSDGMSRVTELFKSSFPRFKEYEQQMRAAAQLALEHWALERSGKLKEKPYRRGHRINIIANTIEPMYKEAANLDNIKMQKKVERLHKALSIIYGIEPWVILKDIWGLEDQEIESIALWMAQTLVSATNKDDLAN